MLIRLVVTNYLSFRDRTEFAMLATREKQHGERVYIDEKRDLKVLPLAAIYGANASGKTNFYRAIEFLRDLVLNPARNPDDPIPTKPFRLDDTGELEPSFFSVEMLTNENSIYRLSFSVTKSAVLEEKLERVDSPDRLIYSRSMTGPNPKWNILYFHAEGQPETELEFINYKTRDTPENQLFISALRGRKIQPIDEVVSWFRDGLQLMTPNTVLKQLEVNLQSMDGLRTYCIDALRNADTGISNLDRREVPLSSVPLPDHFGTVSEMEAYYRKTIAEGKAMLVSTREGQRFALRNEKNQVLVTQLLTVHRTKSGRDVEFVMADESDGTQRFVDLIPAFFDLTDSSRSKLYVIDEIDRSLHTELTRNLLESFLRSHVRSSRSQLIFTTQDVMLLDQDLLRRDEIWFAEKSDEGKSELVGLSDFKDVRADKDIRKSYLLGRFGGVPRILGLPQRHVPPSEIPGAPAT